MNLSEANCPNSGEIIMTIYDELITLADKMDKFALSIERDNDPTIIRDLKQERFRLQKIAEEIRKMQFQTEAIQRSEEATERILFYELLRQKDEMFLQKIKPIVGNEEFEWRAMHHLFTDKEIGQAIETIKRSKVYENME